jgi:hypothetical protein
VIRHVPGRQAGARHRRLPRHAREDGGVARRGSLASRARGAALEAAADSGKVVLEINLPDSAARESLVTDLKHRFS